MELDHSAESALSAFIWPVLSTVKILPRIQVLIFFYQFNSRGPSLNDSVSDSNESLIVG